jgi:hypothetical protein
LEGPSPVLRPLTTACISCSLICSSKNSLIVFIILPFLIIRAISDKADNSANMDYPAFEKLAIEHSVRLTQGMLKRMA